MATERNHSSLRAPAHIISLLNRLHTLSTAQEPAVNNGLKEARQIREKDPIAGSRELDRRMLDKFVALDQDKCEFVYQLILATGATNVVEAGTSFGVSTIYLALGVGENSPTLGKVIATEKESEKAARAREHWKEAGDLVLNHVELREGDLLETLQKDLPMIDLLLLDIWTPLALPTLKVVQPHLKHGAVIITDNTVSSASGYQELLNYLRDPNGSFRTLTLPYSNGLELSVFQPRS